jgi:hypothetical protein
MNKLLILAALLAATLSLSNANADENETQYFIVAPDLSGSASLLTNDDFTKAAIGRVKQEIMTLKKGAWVHIKPFGDGRFDDANRKIRISSKAATPEFVSSLVANTLNEIRAKAGQGQSSTNLLAFLELEELHCETDASHIYLLSDSIEHSLDVSGEALLNGSQALPEPDEGLLSGCKVTIIGLGNVSTGLLLRKQRKHLEKAWRDWFTKAGVDELDIIYRP